MPLYEYQCDACGHRFEVIQKFSDAPIDTCPVCKGTVHKLLSSPAIQFKGSGWYITDYARKGSSDSSGSGDAKATKSAKSETSADSKSTSTETKSEKSDSTSTTAPASSSNPPKT